MTNRWPKSQRTLDTRLSAYELNRIIAIEMSQIIIIIIIIIINIIIIIIIIIIGEGLLSKQLRGGVIFEWSYFWRGL